MAVLIRHSRYRPLPTRFIAETHSSQSRDSVHARGYLLDILFQPSVRGLRKSAQSVYQPVSIDRKHLHGSPVRIRSGRHNICGERPICIFVDIGSYPLMSPSFRTCIDGMDRSASSAPHRQCGIVMLGIYRLIRRIKSIVDFRIKNIRPGLRRLQKEFTQTCHLQSAESIAPIKVTLFTEQ